MAPEPVKKQEPPGDTRTQLAQKMLSLEYGDLSNSDLRTVSQLIVPHGSLDYHASRLQGHNNLKYEDTQMLLSRYMVRLDPHAEKHPTSYKHQLI